MAEKASEERETGPVLPSPNPTNPSATTVTSASSSAQPQQEVSSKQRIQQLRERLAQYNVSIAENLSGRAANATATTHTGTGPSPSSFLSTQQLARDLSAEFQQSAASPVAPSHASPPPASRPPPVRPPTTSNAPTTADSPSRRVSVETGSPGGPSSPVRSAPPIINPKMMNDITASLPTVHEQTASYSSSTTHNNNATSFPGTTSASASFRATSVGNPFQSARADIHQPRQRASVDMMDEAVRRSATASTEAVLRAAQQEAQQASHVFRPTSGNVAGAASPVRSPFLSQRPSFATTTTAAHARAAGAGSPGAARSSHFSPSPARPGTTRDSVATETTDEDENSSAYEELEFDIHEIEEEYEETDTSEQSSSYDDDFDEEEDDETVNAFLKELLEKDDFIRGAVEKTLSQPGQSVSEADRTMNPLIRRAAELYRQRRHEQQQQQSQHSQAASHRDPASTEGGATLDTRRTAPAARIASTGPFSPASVAEAAARGGPVRFGQLETAYCHLVAAQIGAQKLHGKVQLSAFPNALPMLSQAAVMSTRRDELTKAIEELCRTPATQRQLTSLRNAEAATVDKKCAALIEACQTGIQAKALKIVEDQQNVVLGKQRLVAERQKDLEERRVACRAVREEMLKIKRRNATRAAQLTSREATYSRRLEAHAALEADTQARIAEVEHLGKKVSWWLRVLEERNTSLAQKEERLGHMEADVARRRGDMEVFKASTQFHGGRGAKNLSPPPPPPRVNHEK